MDHADANHRVRANQGGSEVPTVRIDGPLPHRVAHQLASHGWRGHRWYWAVAWRLARSTSNAALEVSPSVTLPLEMTDWVAKALYLGIYEQPETRLVSHLVSAGATCIDVGAHIGYYTALLWACAQPSGQISSFEPAPESYENLVHLIEHNHLRGVEPIRSALGQGAGQGVLHLYQANSGLASLLRNPVTEDLRDTVTVQIISLDDFAVARGITSIDFLKVDVEGTEPAVLQGARRLLGEGAICFAQVEVSPLFTPPAMLADVLGELAGGYALYRITQTGRFRFHPALQPISVYALAQAPSQFNLLLARHDEVGRLHKFVR